MHHRASRGSGSSGVSRGRARPERAHPGQAAEEETTILSVRHEPPRVTSSLWHALHFWSKNWPVLTSFPVKQ